MSAGDTTPGPCWPSIVGGPAQTAYADPDFSQYFSPAFCPSGVSMDTDFVSLVSHCMEEKMSVLMVSLILPEYCCHHDSGEI